MVRSETVVDRVGVADSCEKLGQRVDEPRESRVTDSQHCACPSAASLSAERREPRSSRETWRGERAKGGAERARASRMRL